MQSVEQSLNEYLYYEFGFDVHESDKQPAPDWPFRLQPVGAIHAPDGRYTLFAFDANGPHYVLDGPSVQFFPTDTMGSDEVRNQLTGEWWLRQQNPVGLETSVLGDDSVPSLPDRRRAIKRLANAVPGTATIGLFLRSSSQYLAYVKPAGDSAAVVVGSNLPLRHASCPGTSDYRRLLATLGELHADGRLA